MAKQAIAEEHPELDRGEVFELVQEWLRTTDQLVHRITEPDDPSQAAAHRTHV